KPPPKLAASHPVRTRSTASLNTSPLPSDNSESPQPGPPKGGTPNRSTTNQLLRFGVPPLGGQDAAISINGRGGKGEGDEFVADWDLVENNGDYYFWCGDTYLVSGQTIIHNADFENGTCVKYEPGASLEIDGWLDFGDYGQCSGSP